MSDIEQTDYEYDYSFYRQVLTAIWNAAWRDADDLEIGVDISDIPEVKLIFDGYGYNEESGEQDNTNMESYALFIHRDSGTEDFQFPEHDLTPWALIHRPQEEVCIYLWYDVENDELSINGLEETSEHAMTDQEVMTVLQTLYDRWFRAHSVAEESSQPAAPGVAPLNPHAAWPFPTDTGNQK